MLQIYKGLQEVFFISIKFLCHYIIIIFTKTFKICCKVKDLF